MTRRDTEISILGRQVSISISDTGHGINILIAGGDQGHIGAVAAVCPGQPLQLIEFPNHREGIVCQEWADAFCQQYHVPVVVEAGVHYDGISKEEIVVILTALRAELEELLAKHRLSQ